MDVIETLTELSTPAGRADPYPLYARLHEHGTVLPAGHELVVIGYDAISAVLRDPGFRVAAGQPERRDRLLLRGLETLPVTIA